MTPYPVECLAEASLGFRYVFQVIGNPLEAAFHRILQRRHRHAYLVTIIICSAGG